MEEYARAWCQHHFSHQQHMSTSAASPHLFSPLLLAPEETIVESVIDPFCHPRSVWPQPSANPSTSKSPFSSCSSSSSSSEGARESPGPTQVAPPDAEGRAGYLRLLLATETHRRELRRRRRQEQAPPPLQLGADTEQLRQRQLRQLYGAAAERVAAAESRAQLQFDTITDRHRPPLWPNIPLRIRFE